MELRLPLDTSAMVVYAALGMELALMSRLEILRIFLVWIVYQNLRYRSYNVIILKEESPS